MSRRAHPAREALKSLSSLAPALLLAFGAPHAAVAAAPAAPPSWQVTLADSTEPGSPLMIEGRVYSLPDSQPLRDVTVHLWHADAGGSCGNPPGGRFAKLPYMINPSAFQQWLFVEPDEKGFHGSCRLYIRRHTPR